MKSIILSAMLVIGFAASAQPVCQVTSETAQQIDDVNQSEIMAKPKFTTIKELVAADVCVAGYLKEGEATQLARDIMNLSFLPSSQILSAYVARAEATLTAACQASPETIDEVDMIRTSGSHGKVIYASIKRALREDQCVAAKLDQGQIIELAQQIVLGPEGIESTEMMIKLALAK